MKPPPTPRTVKPRKVTETPHLPIVAVSLEDEEFYVERLDEILPLSTLHLFLAGEPSCLVVCLGADRMLVLLDREYGDNPHWQFKVSPNSIYVYNPALQTTRRRDEGTVVGFFGFRSALPGERVRKGKGNFHYPLDPAVFTRRKAGEVLQGEQRLCLRLANWGHNVRTWVEVQRLKISPTQGGLAGQLLRDPRFFPDARRKVPRATNDHVRLSLPGNYYELRAKTTVAYRATYLDMVASHHTIASQIQFPDPDRFWARGDYRVTDATDVTDSHRASLSHADFQFRNRMLSRGIGLLLVDLSVPPIDPGRFPLPYLRKPGQKTVHVFTNELATIRELGASVDAIRAAWISFTPAPGLNKYAEWALRELQRASDGRKAWLKPVLLSAYGVLAARPRATEFAYKQAHSGVRKLYVCGPDKLEVVARVTSRETEIATTNVIYRGLIEAEQRVRTLAFARDLHAQGARVLSLWADSVFVDSDFPLPLLPPEWRVQDYLTRLHFLNATSFESDTLTKIPGLAREDVDSHNRTRQVHAHSLPKSRARDLPKS